MTWCDWGQGMFWYDWRHKIFWFDSRHDMFWCNWGWFKSPFVWRLLSMCFLLKTIKRAIYKLKKFMLHGGTPIPGYSLRLWVARFHVFNINCKYGTWIVIKWLTGLSACVVSCMQCHVIANCWVLTPSLIFCAQFSWPYVFPAFVSHTDLFSISEV